jgi:hypothetical protein
MPESILLGYCRCCSGKVSREAVTCPHCGQPSPYQFGDDGYGEARAQLKQGNKITAIKLVREKSGMGLAEAKAFVESWE